MAELLKEAQERGSAKGKEMILIAKDKKEIPVTVSVSLREDPNGNFIGFFITVADITEEKKFQRELQKKITELERFQKLTVGRELKMVELKKEITILKTELKQTKGRL